MRNIYCIVIHMCGTYPLPEIAGEDKVTREGVGESCVEFQHFEQGLSLDHMQVTVSQRPHVGTCMSKCGLLPENITKHIPFTCKKNSHSIFSAKDRCCWNVIECKTMSGCILI